MTTNKTYNHEIAQAIIDFFVEDDWHYRFDEKKGIFHFGAAVGGKMKKVDYIINVGENDFFTRAAAPLGGDACDADMMARLAEFICRANDGLVRGAFELCWNDGEIAFKMHTDARGIEAPSRAMVKNAVVLPVVMFERYGDGMVEVIFNDNANVKEVVEKCEDPCAILARMMEKVGVQEEEENIVAVQEAEEQADKGAFDLDALLAKINAEIERLQAEEDAKEAEDGTGEEQ